VGLVAWLRAVWMAGGQAEQPVELVADAFAFGGLP
jgi:hypothetical protein